MCSSDLRLPDKSGNVSLQKAFDQQDEVAKFLSNIGAATESRYVLRKTVDSEDFQGTYTSSFSRKSASAFKEVFFYENAEMNAIGFGRFDCGTSLNESDFKKAAIPSLDRGTPVIVDLKAMAHRLEKLGGRVFYLETVEGGHAGRATSAVRARTSALIHEFAWRRTSG